MANYRGTKYYIKKRFDPDSEDFEEAVLSDEPTEEEIKQQIWCVVNQGYSTFTDIREEFRSAKQQLEARVCDPKNLYTEAHQDTIRIFKAAINPKNLRRLLEKLVYDGYLRKEK